MQYALHLAAGFGSQIALTLTRRIPGSLNRIDNQPLYERWLADISGYDRAEIEVVKRVLRIKAIGVPIRVPAPNRWQVGTGPVVRVNSGQCSVNSEQFTVNSEPVAPSVARLEPAPEPVKVEAKAEIRREKVETAVSEPVQTPIPTPAPIPAQPAADSVAVKIVSLIAQQTGYPEDMLDLDLDLEADLGIDTVKQAETFAAIRSEFKIPARDDLNLRSYNTIEKVIGFVEEMRPDLVDE